ncbi:anion permease [Escherichia coli]|nr:anion permease [Escherichia coli]
MIIGAYPLLMFYNTILGVLVYGTGKIAISDYSRVGIVICGIACLIYALCALFYWPLLGIF